MTAALLVALFFSTPALCFTEEQVSRGRAAFEPCKSCHTLSESDPTPPADANHPLWGSKGRKELIRMCESMGRSGTVADLSDYILARMPNNKPGTLTEQQAMDLTALILNANGAQPDGRALTHADMENARIRDVLPRSGVPIWPLVAGAFGASVLAVAVLRWRSRRAAA